MGRVLVVTGGIGSGKSSVCRILEQYGCSVYDADSRVKGLYDSYPELVAGIEVKLGVSLLDDDGKFVASRLAEKIFSDKEALAMVEALVFPVLKEDFAVFSSCNEVSLFESATVLEKPEFDGLGDEVILVDAPVEVRLERAVSRDGATRERIRERMANQRLMNRLSNGYDDPRVSHVIVNDGTEEELGMKVAELAGKLGLTKKL